MEWHIDSDGNAYNELGMVIAPLKKTINDHTTFEIYLWLPQIDLYDDLAVVDTLSEAKAFINKKVSELVSSIKSKFEGLLKIFKKNNSDNDDTKIDEDKKIFNLKVFIKKILKKKKDDTENQSGS